MHYDNRGSMALGASQRGAVLIIGLIMLLLMTIVGLAAIRGSGLQEMMAGNMRERTLAFQAAEAGLREGELFVNENALTADFSGVTPGLYPDLNQPGETPVEMRSKSFWVEDNAISSGLSLEGVGQAPMFTAEKVDVVLPAGVDGGAIDFQSQLNAEETIFYRVTSRGVTESGTTESVVQSMVRP